MPPSDNRTRADKAAAQQAKGAQKNTTKALADISKSIKLLEKRGIAAVIETGRLLHEVAEQHLCEHGEYQDWIKREFG